MLLLFLIILVLLFVVIIAIITIVIITDIILARPPTSLWPSVRSAASVRSAGAWNLQFMGFLQCFIVGKVWGLGRLEVVSLRIVVGSDRLRSRL